MCRCSVCPIRSQEKIYLDGFDEKATYRLEGTEEVYTGSMLMKAGFLIRGLHGDFKSKLYHFVRV